MRTAPARRARPAFPARLRGILAAARWILALPALGPAAATAQVENVPVSNQVYEFIDRLGVRGILPLASTTTIPWSRAEVAGLLRLASTKADRLSGPENRYLEKFLAEFDREMPAPRPGDLEASIVGRPRPVGLFNGASFAELFSDREKFLYYYDDSTASLRLEFLGALEHRRGGGDSYPWTHASFGTHGFRARGTIAARLGYFAQVTNGTLWGDHDFALSDPRLRANFKFNENDSPYFDFAEAYVRADLSWLGIEFGREFVRLGTGYSDRLVLSDNAPAVDMLRIDARHGAVRYTFIHGSVLFEPLDFSEGGPAAVPPWAQEGVPLFNKYVALHRLEVSAFGLLNAAFSEAVVYARPSPEFAYLNPLIFLKSAEHSLRDRDNTMMAFDLELFPLAGYKLFGGLLVDDVDFSKLGTGWWGNQFAWQGGLYAANVAGLPEVDAHLEYSRIEPYVYSNRLQGNAFTNGGTVLGHLLGPNSDEWLLRLVARPAHWLRGSLGVRRVRHGANVVENGVVLLNAGGDPLAGHRTGDGDSAEFLGGVLTETRSLEARAWWEPVTNFVIAGAWEIRRTTTPGSRTVDHLLGVRGILEF